MGCGASADAPITHDDLLQFGDSYRTSLQDMRAKDPQVRVCVCVCVCVRVCISLLLSLSLTLSTTTATR